MLPALPTLQLVLVSEAGIVASTACDSSSIIDELPGAALYVRSEPLYGAWTPHSLMVKYVVAGVLGFVVVEPDLCVGLVDWFTAVLVLSGDFLWCE